MSRLQLSQKVSLFVLNAFAGLERERKAKMQQKTQTIVARLTRRLNLQN